MSSLDIAEEPLSGFKTGVQKERFNTGGGPSNKDKTDELIYMLSGIIEPPSDQGWATLVWLSNLCVVNTWD